MKNTTLFFLVALGTALVAGLLIGQGAWSYYVKKGEIDQKRLVQDAIDGCLKAGTTSWTDGANSNAYISAPYEPAYDKCMRDKGY